MAARPSIFTDYVDTILRTIETSRNDPAQLRGLVYDLARVALGKQVLLAYHQLGRDALQEHLRTLEHAIEHVEAISLHQLPAPSHQLPALSHIEDADTASANSFIDQRDELHWRDANTRTFPPLIEVVDVSPIAVEPAGKPKRNSLRIWPFAAALMLLGSIATVVASVVLYQEYTLLSTAKESLSRAVSNSITPQNNPEIHPHTNQQALSATDSQAASRYSGPLPSAYGVYALSGGRLYPLEPLPIRVPDPRVAISATFSLSSNVTLQGKLAFVIFRRDLITNAPEDVSVRVVARIIQNVKFNGAAPPVKSPIENEFAVRGKTYGYKVSPIDDRPDMVLITSNAEQILPAGRYALVLKGVGYDFTVDGPDSDPSHCLERTNAVGGTFYSECPKIPLRG